MNILITGCQGQLGSELKALATPSDFCRYFFTDINELDITDARAVNQFVQENQIDVVVNCAAYTAVDKAESDLGLCERLNAIAPQYLAEAIEKRGGTLVHVSTDYVFDGKGFQPYKEDAPTNPLTVYGRTKLEGERKAMQACKRTVVVRTAWLYSTYGNNFVQTILRLAHEKEVLGVVADQIGTPTYARDLARTILQIIAKGIRPGIFHFTNEGTCSWYDFAYAIVRFAGIDRCQIKPLLTANYPTPAQRPHYSVLDKTKIKEVYGIDIAHWTESLKDCLNRLQNN
ncbi:MAG: dTDP-4-dehydrorhamnose reductase [Alloprevotella sp.]|nr:dTDP-4-dehydrorhamnose reductase [Alloprevotella sp.]